MTGRGSPYTVCLVTLGCAKNVVDSERALGALEREGFALSTEPAGADLIVVNTCGFIEAAKQESVEEILRLAALKENGRSRRLVVAGCLARRYRAQLEAVLPEVDRFLGLVDPAETVALARSLAALEQREPPACTSPVPAVPVRRLTTPAHYAWLKIAEGCNNPCTFCAIPLMRGRLRSVAPDQLVAEARQLAAGGVRELILVAQDSTHYGADRPSGDRPSAERTRLPDLLRRLGTEVPGLAWLRLMYAYPAHVTDELLAALADTPKVVPYLDLPIQHTSDRMLAAMRRSITADRQRALLERIRERVPGIALRTSLLVGFPGEREEDFTELVEAVRTFRFERLGVFAWSAEEGTPAYELPGRVNPVEVERRRAELMQVQAGIAAERNRALEGSVTEVLVEEVLEDLPPFHYLGRTPADAPEVDQGIYLERPAGDFPERLRHLRPGDLVRAEVVGATDFDLEGVLLPEPPR
jgi:ribosomal protein S12 methylthiotransferase